MEWRGTVTGGRSLDVEPDWLMSVLTLDEEPEKVKVNAGAAPS